MADNSYKIEEIINPISTSVLVIDIQNAYCSPNGSLARLGYDVSINQGILPKIQTFLQSARKFHIPIIFTRMIEDPAYMAANARLKAVLCPKSIDAISSPNTPDFEYAEVKPDVTDTEIIKKSYDAFSNPDLERALNKNNIRNTIIIGVNGDVCVDTTVRSAFTKGYNVVVPKDLIGTIKEKIYRQESAIELWEQIFAYVLDSASIVSSWNGGINN